jgi:hypothetical protein
MRNLLANLAAIASQVSPGEAGATIGLALVAIGCWRLSAEAALIVVGVVLFTCSTIGMLRR